MGWHPAWGGFRVGAYYCRKCGFCYPESGRCRVCNQLLAWRYDLRPDPPDRLPPVIKRELEPLPREAAAEWAADWAWVEYVAEETGWPQAEVFASYPRDHRVRWRP